MQKDGLDWHFADECRPAKCGVYQVTKSKTSIPLAATPRLAHLFDRSSPEPFFKGSKVAELEETGSNLSPTGALVYAKREFLSSARCAREAMAVSRSRHVKSRIITGFQMARQVWIAYP